LKHHYKKIKITISIKGGNLCVCEKTTMREREGGREGERERPCALSRKL
jgi:hypothetical protein